MKITPLILVGIILFGGFMALRYEVSSILVRALIAALGAVILYFAIMASKKIDTNE